MFKKCAPWRFVYNRTISKKVLENLATDFKIVCGGGVILDLFANQNNRRAIEYFFFSFLSKSEKISPFSPSWFLFLSLSSLAFHLSHPHPLPFSPASTLLTLLFLTSSLFPSTLSATWNVKEKQDTQISCVSVFCILFLWIFGIIKTSCCSPFWGSSRRRLW